MSVVKIIIIFIIVLARLQITMASSSLMIINKSMQLIAPSKIDCIELSLEVTCGNNYGIPYVILIILLLNIGMDQKFIRIKKTYNI